jgi:predicted transcriptional regulator
MESLTIRISRSTHARLRALAEKADATMAEVVDRAVGDYERRQFWADYHAAYAAIQADPTAADELRRETEAWDSTCGDGLEG